MVVLASDIELRYTVAASAGDLQAGTAAGSLGDQVSTTQITSGTLHNVFDLLTGAENAASDVEYRCIAVCNTNSTDTWTGVDVWIHSQVAGGATLAIGLDPAGVVATDLGSAQGATIANESSAPAGVSFSTPTEGAPLAVGNLGPNQCRLIWLRRTATNSSAVSYDGATLRFSGADS